MDVVVQMIAQAKDMAGKPVNPTVEGIYKAAVLSQNQHHMIDKGKQAAQAKKISTVKPKGKEPTFQLQQQQPPHQPLQAGDANAPGKRKQTHHSKKMKQPMSLTHLKVSLGCLHSEQNKEGGREPLGSRVLFRGAIGETQRELD